MTEFPWFFPVMCGIDWADEEVFVDERVFIRLGMKNAKRL